METYSRVKSSTKQVALSSEHNDHARLAGFWPDPDAAYDEHNKAMKEARAASKTFFFGLT